MKLSNSFMYAICFLIGGVLIAGFSFASEESWTYAGVEYRLPKPMAEIQLPADLPETYEVVQGDTLWGISGRLMTDPLLWPLIWQENMDTIQNPHLIFPGQQIRLPKGMMIAAGSPPPPATSGATEITGEEEAESGEGEDSSAAATGWKPRPATSRSVIVSSGYISPDEPAGPKIIGSDNEAFNLSTDDIVFIDGGTDKNIEPEQDMFVLRKMHKIYHPISGRYLGWMVHVVGEIQTLCVNEFSTMARINMAYQDVNRGDIVVKWEEIPIPETVKSPDMDICNPSTKQLPGTIIESFHGGPMFSDAVSMGKGDIAYIDLGSKDGVAPGYYFTIFHHNPGNPNLPRYVSGEAFVLKVTETTATVLLTQSRTAIYIGDQIELKQ